jgi:hypothetical protein
MTIMPFVGLLGSEGKKIMNDFAILLVLLIGWFVISERAVRLIARVFGYDGLCQMDR